jgi:hypothetical protein
LNKGSPESQTERKQLLRGIADLEVRGSTAFARLADLVKQDVNLTDLAERPDVLEAIDAARKKFLDDLSAIAAKEPVPPKLPFKDVRIDEPFAEHLTKNPLVMELAGAIIIDLGEPDKLIAGVGKVVLKDGSAEDLERARRVATLKARIAVIGERDGTHVSYLKKVEDRVVIIKDDAGEKVSSVSERLKITREKIEGWAKGLPPVGTWRSEDGKILYVAVGGKLSRTK